MEMNAWDLVPYTYVHTLSIFGMADTTPLIKVTGITNAHPLLLN